MLTDIPILIFNEIFIYLDYKDKVNLSFLCKRFLKFSYILISKNKLGTVIGNSTNIDINIYKILLKLNNIKKATRSILLVLIYL